MDKSVYIRNPRIHPIGVGSHVCWVGDVTRPTRGVPLHALADLALSASRAAPFSFTFCVLNTSFETMTSTASLALSESSTQSAATMRVIVIKIC